MSVAFCVFPHAAIGLYLKYDPEYDLPMLEDTPKIGEAGSRTREEFFKEFLRILEPPFVKSAAEGFFENIRQIESLVQMPYVMFAFLEVESHFYSRLQSSMQEHWSQRIDYLTFMEEHYKRMKPFKVEEVMPDFDKRIRKRFHEALTEPSYGPF